MHASSATVKPLATAISLDTLPSDVILEAIIPPLGAQFQIFNIVSLGQSSRSLNGNCQELLNMLRGRKQSTLLNDGTLRDYAVINLHLRTLARHANSQRAMLEILRQAWNQPAGGRLLAAMSTFPFSICFWQTRHTAEESELQDMQFLSFELSEGLTRAESQENFLPLLEVAAAAQRAGGGDIGLARAVSTHLKTLTGKQQIDLLDQFFDMEQVAKMAPLQIDRTTALLWMENQIKNPEKGLSSNEPRPQNQVTPVLWLVQFVCRQLTTADRDSFFSSFLESQSNHISREEFDDLVAYLDANPRYGAKEWAQPVPDWFNDLVRPQQPNFSAALVAQMAADMEQFRVNFDSYLIETEDLIAMQPSGASGNTSNSSRNDTHNQGNPPAPANAPAQDQPAANAQRARRRKKVKKNPCQQM